MSCCTFCTFTPLSCVALEAKLSLLLRFLGHGAFRPEADRAACPPSTAPTRTTVPSWPYRFQNRVSQTTTRPFCPQANMAPSGEQVPAELCVAARILLPAEKCISSLIDLCHKPIDIQTVSQQISNDNDQIYISVSCISCLDLRTHEKTICSQPHVQTSDHQLDDMTPPELPRLRQSEIACRWDCRKIVGSGGARRPTAPRELGRLESEIACSFSCLAHLF
jgi:hypothetical protein